MKTLKRTLCLMLSIIMALSCLSVAAAAVEEEKFTSTLKTATTVSNKDSAKLTLDELDEILASQNNGEGIYFPLVEGVIDIDFRNVNGVCSTLDLLKRFIEADNIFDLGPTALIKAALGQLGDDINLKNWQTGMKRTGDDIAILTNLLGFAGDNNKVVSGILKGNYDMGVINNFINIDEMLGSEGISGILKEALIGLAYEKGSAEYNNALNTYKNDIDAFIYGKLLPSFIGSTLPGLTVSTASTIDSLLIDIYNICLEKYIKPELQELYVDLSGSNIPELKALAGVLNLNGSTYDYDSLIYSHDKTLKEQINTVIGAYVKNLMPAYDGWAAGGYDVFNTNVENAIKYIASVSGITGNTLEEIGIATTLLIIKNNDFGAFGEGFENCSTPEELAAAFLINVANDMKIGVNYTGNESYLVVAGDILAAWASDIPFTDNSGNTYLPGGGKDVFEVANYIVNYFLFDREMASVLGLSTTKAESIFSKIDKIADYFGETKAKGVNFNSESFIKGLIDGMFTLDIGALLELTIVPILDNAGPVRAEEFIYKSVQYYINNWAGRTLFPAYQAKAFTNALSNQSIGNMAEAFLATIAERKSAVVTLTTFIIAILTEHNVEITMQKLVATGNALSPKITVKSNGKALTVNKDYTITAENPVTPGAYKAVISGTGIYSGDIEINYNVAMDKVNTLSFSDAKTTSVKLSWNKVAYADSYTVSVYDSANKLVSKQVGITGTSYTVSGLSAGKDYKVRVQAVSNTYGATEAKETTVSTATSAVTKLKASTTASTAKLSWSAASGATHYKIEYKTSSAKSWKTAATTSKTSYTVSGLTGYTTYNFRVTALKKLADGTYVAATATSVNAKTLLGTPSSLKASATSSTITLSWSKVANADKYEVRQYKSGKWKTLTTTKKTSYKISKLKSGTKYKFSVRAVKGKSTYGTAKELSAYTLLPTPTKVKVASTTTTTAKLSWSKVSGASSYEVYAYIGKKWTKVGSTKKTSITVKSLSSGTKTKLKVRAVAKNTKSAFSSEVTALTLVGKVSSLKTSLRKTNSITLTWKKTTGATSYEIYRYTDGKWKKVGTTTKTTYTDSKSLSKGTQYQYKVRAVQKVSKKSTRYGDYSSVLKAKTTIIGSSRF